MNKKGFTLVEVLAIIIILAVITVIAVPNISKRIKSSEEQTQNVLNTKIENAAKIYAAKYYADKIVNCPTNHTSTNICDNSHPLVFTLDDLEKDGLLRLASGECEDSSGDRLGGTIDVIFDSSNAIKFNYKNISKFNPGSGPISNNCHSCSVDSTANPNGCRR